MLRRLGLAVLFALAAGNAHAAVWTPDFANSTIQWQAFWNTSPVNGRFRTWQTDFELDPAAPEKGHIKTIITLASVDTQYPERDEALKGPDWFNTAAYPQAVFESHRITKTTQGYVAAGKLTLGGVTLPLAFPFTFTVKPEPGHTQQAFLASTFKVSRKAFHIGSGAWKDTGQIKEMVTVKINLTLTAPQ